MSARLKVLFITHTVDAMGGAARSLRELLLAWDVDADLLLHRFNDQSDDAAIRAFFGPRIRRISRQWLPYDMCYRGRPTMAQSPRRHLLFPVLWRAQRDRFHRFVAREGYDVVHLNSVVLHPLVGATQPFILHVREILDGAQPAARASASRAAGVVFIDEATAAPFAGERLRASITLNNPVDMRGVGSLPPRAAERLGGDPAALTVFAMIGTLIPEKGADVVVEAFRRVAGASLRLLLVGDGDREYRGRLQQLAAGDRRIVFWGNEPDIDAVLTLSDHVVRGEAYHCVGRTIYEALYAGCGVIVPGDATSHTFFEFDRFADRIHFYRPSDRAELARQLAARAGTKRLSTGGGANVEEYAQRFDRFVRGAVGKPV